MLALVPDQDREIDTAESAADRNGQQARVARTITVATPAFDVLTGHPSAPVTETLEVIEFRVIDGGLS